MKWHCKGRGWGWILFGSALICPCLGYSQGLSNLWLGGYGQGNGAPYGASDIEFAGGSPVISLQPSRYIDLGRTAANISDPTGNLLFFSNGAVVGTQSGDTMQNGAGLAPSDYTDNWYPEALQIPQAALILPDPGSSVRYYLFHGTVDDIPTQTASFLYVTTVDMSLNAGLGAVVQKNQVLHSGILQPGRLSAVRHGNGRDWWVYTHEANTDRYWRFLVTPSGVTGPFDQSIGVVRPPDAGRTAFSPDGSKFAYYWGISDLDIFSVDRCTGEFSDPVHIDIDDYNGSAGVAFSPNSRFLYVSSVLDVYQVDTEAPDVAGSILPIAYWDSTYSPFPPFATVFNAAQLASDGKVYISTGNGTDKLHVINAPDSFGLACDIVQRQVSLPTIWFNSLPNHPNYHLGALDGSICDSLDVGVAEEPEHLNLSLYPNPNNGAFAITFAPQPESGWLEVHALDGRLVHREPVAAWSQLKRVEVPRLAPGMYQCKVRFGRKEAAKRFVVE